VTVIEHTDGEGHRVVWYEGRLSVYGKPSMTADDGTVAVGVDWPEPPFAQGAVVALREAAEKASAAHSVTEQRDILSEAIEATLDRLGGQSQNSAQIDGGSEA
jgi:hypothetical protein